MRVYIIHISKGTRLLGSPIFFTLAKVDIGKFIHIGMYGYKNIFFTIGYGTFFAI